MGLRELMTWLKSSNRWAQWLTKQDGREKIYVGVKKLKRQYPDLVKSLTRDGTREAANLFWENLTATRPKELPRSIVAVIAEHERIKAWAIEQGDTDTANDQQKMIESWREEAKKKTPYEPQRMDYPIGMLPQSAQLVWQDRGNRKKAKTKDRAITAQIEAFMGFKKSAVEGETITADSWEALRCHLKILREFVGDDKDVSVLDEQFVLGFYGYLTTKSAKEKKWSPAYVHTVFGSAKQFVRHLWGLRLIDLPRNLDDKRLTFNRKLKKIITWSPAEIKKFLASAPAKTQLYALLMLNCGNYSIDIATLRHDHVDWKAGRIIRKRHKTEDVENAPEVNWKLWSTTFDLLKQHRSDHKQFVLLNEDGGPLRASRIDTDDDGTDKLNKKDNIRSAVGRVIRKLKIKKGPKHLRKTGGSMLDNHSVFGRYAQYFLGESPRSVAGRHYVEPSQDQFDAAVAWLGKQFGL